MDTSTNERIKSSQDKDEASQRLKFARILTGLSMRIFAEKHGINFGYLLKQESGNRPPTREALKEILPCLQKEGVNCTDEWIHSGTGFFPTLGRHNHWYQLHKSDDEETTQNLTE